MPLCRLSLKKLAQREGALNRLAYTRRLHNRQEPTKRSTTILCVGPRCNGQMRDMLNCLADRRQSTSSISVPRIQRISRMQKAHSKQAKVFC